MEGLFKELVERYGFRDYTGHIELEIGVDRSQKIIIFRDGKCMVIEYINAAEFVSSVNLHYKVSSIHEVRIIYRALTGKDLNNTIKK